jgi:hypothetical protein
MPVEGRALTCMGLLKSSANLDVAPFCLSASMTEPLDVPRGVRRSARIIAPHTCIRWVDETRTMMQ